MGEVVTLHRSTAPLPETLHSVARWRLDKLATEGSPQARLQAASGLTTVALSILAQHFGYAEALRLVSEHASVCGATCGSE